MNQVPIVERAFQLAADCTSLKELRQALKREGYSSITVETNLSGLGIRRELQSRYNDGAGSKKRGPTGR